MIIRVLKHRLKKRGEAGSPCRTPFVMGREISMSQLFNNNNNNNNNNNENFFYLYITLSTKLTDSSKSTINDEK